jgi:hypothetical protein
MPGNRISALFMTCLMLASSGFLAAGSPSVVISSPPAGTVSPTKTVTVSGTSSGSDDAWLDGSLEDFSAGVRQSTVVDTSGPISVDKYYDDFNDNSLDLSRWTKKLESNGATISETGGKLHVSASSTTSTYWACRGDVESTASVAWSVSADLASYSGSGSGYATAIALYQDESNLISVSQTYDPGSWGSSTVRVLWASVEGGAVKENNVKEATAGPHNYRIEYSGGTASVFQDGQIIGSKAISLSDCHLLIDNAARSPGDTLTADWDNVALDYNKTGKLKLDNLYDDFNDNSLDLARWTKTDEANGATMSEAGGRLRISCRSTTSTFWACRGRLTSTATVAWSISGDLASFSGSGSGYASGLVMYQDASNMISVTQTYDPGSWGSTVRVLWASVEGGAVTENNVKEATAGQHNYRIEYSGGTASVFQDAQIIGSKAISLSNCHLLVENAVRASGDAMTAEWDNIILDYPSTGTFTSEAFDTLSVNPVMKRVDWNGTAPAATAIAVQVRASDSDDMSGATAWAAVTKGQSSGFPPVKRYLQYKVTLTSNGQNTPAFEKIRLTYNKPVAKVEVSIDDKQTWTTATGTAMWSIDLVLPENTCTIWVRATDVMGDINLTSRPIDVDTTPPTGKVIINNRAAFTIAREVTLALDATDHYGVQSMMISEMEDFSDVAWQDYADNLTFTLAQGDGQKTVYVKFQDRNGHSSETYNATIVLDTLPPTGGILVDGGAQYTRNATVIAALEGSDPIGLDGMMVSTDQSFTGAQWVDFAAEKTVALSPGSGERTVYVKFRDSGGHVSQAFKDSILMDQSPPEVRLSCNGGAAYSRSANVSVELAATENYQAVSMQLGPGEGTSITILPWVPFTTGNNLTLPGGEGAKTVSARLQDAAGNVGAANSTSIIFDYTAPNTTMGALAATSLRAAFPVLWSAADATSGVLWYDVQYMAGNGAWKDLLTHTNLTTTTFTGDDLETYSFRARAQDRAGNLEEYPATAGNAVTVQLPEPAVSITKPAENKQIAGKTTVTGTCQKITGGRNITRVEWRVDNGTWAAADGTLNWSFGLDSTKLKDGKHTLQVRTYDGKHYSAVIERPFRVKNAKAAGFIPADGALLLLGCIAIGIAMFAARRKQDRQDGLARKIVQRTKD